MARGTANNEPVVSQANTPAYRENYPLSGRVQRGRWVWDAEQGHLVSAEQYRPAPRAIDAPIITDRLHEGTTFDDGHSARGIGTRRTRRAFMREAGVQDATTGS